MKRILSPILSLIFICFAIAGEEVNVKIPDRTFSILLPDTAAYAAFLVNQKTSLADHQLRVKVASLTDGQGIWSKRFYPGRFVQICDQGVLVEEAFGIKLFDFKTGNEIRTILHKPVYIDSKNDIMLGVKGGNCDKLSCFSLSTGEKIWESKIPKNKGLNWEYVSQPDSSTIIFRADFLGCLNLRNGDMKMHPLKTAILDKKAILLGTGSFAAGSMLGSAIFGGLSGALAGIGSYAAAYRPYIDNFCSETLTRDSSIYIADRENILCLTSEMEIRWQTPLPKGAGSRSHISFTGDTISMLNIGYLTKDGKRYKSGKPFMASFDRRTGECFGWSFFPEKWDENEFGNYLNFVFAPIWVCDKTEKIFSRLEASKGYCYLRNIGGDLLAVDQDLMIANRVKASDVYEQIATVDNGYIICCNGNPVRFIHIDSQGKPIEEYEDGTTDIMLRDRDLIRKTDTSLFISDISQK